MTVGDRIRQTRIEKGLSQTELADRANYFDKTRISKIEHAGNDISMKQVRRIANALGVSSAYLMGWEDTDIDYKLQAERSEAEALFEKYKNLSPEKKIEFQNYLEFLQSRP